jgi:crotonobetainyl-CoA:carnitine CoA-transferase CaiB-like acyl-CoA transferase
MNSTVQEPAAAPAQDWPQPLAGVRVIDFSQLLPGPYCTHLLTELGAETIKVEAPGGDPLRKMNAAKFNFYNRGKQSVCVDAREPEARDFLLRLIADADVVVEGFRPGAMDRLGLGYEAARAVNPHLVYASISGYGQTGPYARWPGHDVNFVAAGGYFADSLDINNGSMQRPRLRISDLSAAMSSAFVIAALLRTPREQRSATHLDASMFDAMAHLMLPPILGMNAETAADPTLRGDVLADVALYRTADGQAISIATLEDKFWLNLVDALRARFPEIAHPRWTERAGRTAHKRELAVLLARVFESFTLAELEQLLPPEQICWTRVVRGDDLLRDPQVLAHDLVADTPHGRRPTFPIALNGTRAPATADGPTLGQHTQQLMVAYAGKTGGA